MNKKTKPIELEEVSIRFSGDSGDGIKGCKGVGDKGAKKIIDGLYGYPLLKSVVKTYLDKGQTKEDIRLNYRLLKLGM